MPTYAVLLKFTDQGASTVKDLPQRVRASRATSEQLGVTWGNAYLTQGRYDALVMAEAPDEETMAVMALAIGSRGNVHTETLRAFNEQEWERIVQRLP